MAQHGRLRGNATPEELEDKRREIDAARQFDHAHPPRTITEQLRLIPTGCSGVGERYNGHGGYGYCPSPGKCKAELDRRR